MNAREAISHVRQARGIEGWLSEEAALLFALLDAVQQATGIKGNVFEIGVHHGKSAILLGNLAAQSNCQFGVCDIFDDQNGNLSQSGQGDRKRFVANITAHCPKTLDYKIFQTLSSELTPQEIGTGYRLFHVDGGHNVDEALGDLELAGKCLVKGGVIVLDDAFNPPWPGVTEAAMLFLQRHDEFEPVTIGFNKLVLAHTEDSARYRRAIDDRQMRDQFLLGAPWRIKTLDFAGHPTRIFYWPTTVKRRSFRQWLCRALESSPLLRHILHCVHVRTGPLDGPADNDMIAET